MILYRHKNNNQKNSFVSSDSSNDDQQWLTTKRPLKNQKGLASVEATVLMLLFVSMLYYSFGFFGIVHTAIIHNIHARTYALETFRHRANLAHFRSNQLDPVMHYYNRGSRVHGINTDGESNPTTQKATERPITMGLEIDQSNRQENTHNSDVFNRIPAQGRNTTVGVNPVWIKVLYGVCLNSRCGG